ncbi:MAG TPA: DegT/DnrJ/EryC1/StrS aminotransferase family protein, partial [Planctomycetaceae bacterium]|nr:DegT/DnrJ/EryC1/StrS aminotransferase family protein [Planctomycetaceae bacterium]
MTTQCHLSNEAIPFALPAIGREEIESVCRVLESGWLNTGEEARKFEREFAAAVEAPHAVAVNSATAGLHLALEALGIGPGDRVLVPTWTFTATAEVAHHVGATVELVDIDESTLLLDLDVVERRMREDVSVRAVIPVHFAGQTCDMQRLIA